MSGLRSVFEDVAPLTVGIEEEVMALDPETLDLGRADAFLPEDHPHIKGELPASQLELITEPADSVPEAIAQLAQARQAAATAAAGTARLAGAGVHPFSAPLGELSTGERYDAILAEYGDVARAQLVCALQVHVAVGGADRTLGVYNGLRGHLPELAALAANAPFFAGRDTGMASVRPLIGTMLPRQGVPPVIESWEHFEDTLAWGVTSGAAPEPRRWWWELRPHIAYGTLEIRVCDTQATMGESAAVAAYAHSLVGWLSERFDNGEELGSAETWRIAENRWAACRAGVDGSFADLVSGERRPVRELLLERVEQLTPVARRLGCADELAQVPALATHNGALRLREAGADAAAGWLADRFLS